MAERAWAGGGRGGGRAARRAGGGGGSPSTMSPARAHAPLVLIAALCALIGLLPGESTVFC